MRLSTAFMLGITTCELSPGNMNNCALGAALNAVGVKKGSQGKRWDALGKEWPWTMEYMNREDRWYCAIYRAFDGPVCSGEMTLEQLYDFIKQIEPDCDCCRFNCDCATKQVLTPEEAHGAV